ncbi:sulfite exporter TauE/SafE family protein [Nitrincola sp.]|uniref:sulfite exporter TauE/SafE family protein n=1 Tax=Nitrincola sp. TaxID=1926584 RepID=UPI003A8E02B0
MDITLVCLLVAGLITGFSKFSIGGMGVLILPILLIAFPGPEVLAITIPMYILTDIIAAATYHKHIDWGALTRLLPLCLVGVAIGAWLLSGLSNGHFRALLGCLIVGMLVLGILLDFRDTQFMKLPIIGHLMGAITGFISITANSAGPLVSLYLMEQKLEKESYIATRVWTFFLINLFKVPFFLHLDLLHQDTLWLGLQALPGLAVGGAIGYWLIRRLQFRHIKWLIRGMSTVAAIQLFGFS